MIDLPIYLPIPEVSQGADKLNRISSTSAKKSWLSLKYCLSAAIDCLNAGRLPPLKAFRLAVALPAAV